MNLYAFFPFQRHFEHVHALLSAAGKDFPSHKCLRGFAKICPVALVLFAGSPAPTNANVYASNIRIRGSIVSTPTSATVFAPCDSVHISYLLNEPATLGVTVEILSGTNVVRTFFFPGGGAGTLKGGNDLVWDVKDEFAAVVPFGNYTVRVTAGTDGYFDWTQISDDFNEGNYVYRPRSIEVNRNPNSPDYGRIFVANAEQGFNPDGLAGDRVGLFKFNADGSPADGFSFSTGGWPWMGSNTSPFKLEISADDHLCVNDWFDGGIVLRFDQNISSPPQTLVLRPDNRPTSANLGGFCLTTDGNDSFLWMADTTPGGAGIRRWPVSSIGAVATNDVGSTVVRTGEDSDLNIAPYDVAIDLSNRIYTIQFTETNNDPIGRVMRFSAADGLEALTNADWVIGGGDNSMRGASGIAVDPTGTYVAVAFAGAGTGLSRSGGAVRVFSADDGSDVQSFSPGPFHDHTDVAWDAVGNLYLCDNWDSTWRIYSPPGPNQATTVSAQILSVAPLPLVPVVQAVGYSNGEFIFSLRGRANINYIIIASTNMLTWEPVLTNTASCAEPISVPVTGHQRFFRAYPE